MARPSVQAAIALALALGSTACPKPQDPAPVHSPDAGDPIAEAKALFLRGRQAMSEGHPEEALGLLRRAAELNPLDALPWANIGTLTTENGDLDDAIVAWTEATKRDPTHAGFSAQLERLSTLKKKGIALPKVTALDLRGRCAKCHRWTDPGVLPRFTWEPIIRAMWGFGEGFDGLDPRAVSAWFRIRSPELIAVPNRRAGVGIGKLPLERQPLGPQPVQGRPGVANVRLIDLFGDARLEVLASDMVNGKVFLGLPAGGGLDLFVLTSIPNPAHIEMADLDGDGLRDLLVANLGSVIPEVHKRGTAVWLRQKPDRTFDSIVLAEGYGRIADVRAGDLDGDGDLDLVLAEYGSRLVGGVHVLENRGGKKGGKPRLRAKTLDSRAGAIHTPLIDLDGDGKLDVLAIHAEHHEVIVAHLNRGKLAFEAKTIFEAPHPSWGYTGMQLADIDGDGDADIVATNGDGFDAGGDVGGLLQPFHGVQIFENTGGAVFTPRPHMPFRGAHRAEVADLDGDGDMDIVASAFQPFLPLAAQRELELDGVVWFDQTSPWTFSRRAIEAHVTEHATLATGDYDVDGDIDIAVGVFVTSKIDPTAAPNTQGPGLWERTGGDVRGDFIHLWVNRRLSPRGNQP